MSFRDWLVIIVLTFTAAFLGMVFTTVAPVLPMTAAHFGGGSHGALIAEWLLTMPSIGVVIGGPLVGWFVERFGARRILLICLAIFGLAGSAGLVIEDSTVLLASRFVVGLVATGQLTAATNIIGEQFSGPRRGKVVGLATAFATLGGIVIVLSAGALAQGFGWHAPFALYATAFPILLLAIAVIAPSVPRKTIAATKMGVLLPLLPMYLVVTVTMIASFLSTIQLPQLLSEDGIASPQTLSVALGLGTLATAGGAFSYSGLRARLGGGWTVSIGLFLQGLGIVGLAAGHGLVQLPLAAIVLNLGSGILNPAFNHRVLDEAPEMVRGRAVGLLFTAQFAGPFLNTALIVPAIGAFGRREILAVIGLMMLIATLTATIRRGSGVAGPAAGH